jgi:hypothetical protein
MDLKTVGGQNNHYLKPRRRARARTDAREDARASDVDSKTDRLCRGRVAANVARRIACERVWITRLARGAKTRRARRLMIFKAF